MSTNKKHTGGTNSSKDVIYIDVDDEITGIIDKLRGSQKKIVALVLPKRAAVLQSVVNMKLLKRAATDSKKNLVLITSEAGLMPLAGTVGLHVAKSLNSKPEIPEKPAAAARPAADEAAEVDEAADVSLDGSKPVGELSGSYPPDDDEDEDSIELDNDEDTTGAEAEGQGGGKPAKGKNKKFKIPNFNKFRIMLALGAAGVILLSALGYAAVAVWPKATVTIKTNRQAINANLGLTLKTGDDVELDEEESIIPAQLQETKKTSEQKAEATGEENKGKKATGKVTLILEDCSKPQVIIPAGTGVSAKGKTFITQESASLTRVENGIGECRNDENPGDTTEVVSVVAQSAGSSYNIGSSTFDVGGQSNVRGESSSAMTGGTDEIVKVVSQSDIDNAKQKLEEEDIQPITDELRNALIDKGLFPVESTMSVGDPKTETSVKAGEEAEEVTVTQTTTYSMMGVNEGDLKKLIDKAVEDEIESDSQSIIDYGLEDAVFNIDSNNSDGANIAFFTTVVSGTELDVEAIKEQVAGKKAGNAKDLISADPGVDDVVVEYSPFWVSSIPKSTDKITVIIEEPEVTSDDAGSSP